MAWRDVLSTKKIKKYGAKTVNYTLCVYSTCHIEKIKNKYTSSIQPYYIYFFVRVISIFIPVFIYSGGVKAKLVL